MITDPKESQILIDLVGVEYDDSIGEYWTLYEAAE
jgi:hypothetical protein